MVWKLLEPRDRGHVHKATSARDAGRMSWKMTSRKSALTRDRTSEEFLVCTCSIQMLLYSNLSQNQNQTDPFTRQALCYALKRVRQCVVMKCENQPTELCVRSREYKKSVIQDFSIIDEPLQILDESISVETILQKLVHIETNFRNLNLSALDTTNQPKNEVPKGQALLWIIKKHWQSIVHTGKCKSKIWPF